MQIEKCKVNILRGEPHPELVASYACDEFKTHPIKSYLQGKPPKRSQTLQKNCKDCACI